MYYIDEKDINHDETKYRGDMLRNLSKQINNLSQKIPVMKDITDINTVIFNCTKTV